MGKIPAENPIDRDNTGQNYKLCCNKSMGTEQEDPRSVLLDLREITRWVVMSD